MIPVAAYATGDPDDDYYVSNVHAFRNLVEDGDMLIIGEYRLPYVTIPDEPASATYMILLLDDSGTQVGFCVPYSYFDYGYNLGAWSMYFSADDALTWSDSYTVRIAQSPAYFTTPDVYNYEMQSSDWTASTEQVDNQDELAIAVISTAERMEAEYTDYSLIESGITGTVLYSPTGENYFRNVISGIQAMAPSLFLYQMIPYDSTTLDYSTNMSDNYTSRYDGTWVETETEATANQFGLTTTAIMALIFSLPVCLGFIIVSAKKFYKVEPGLLTSAVVVMATFMMGWLPAAIFATIYQLMGLYLAYVWFYARG
jgi:hypothetical protein